MIATGERKRGRLAGGAPTRETYAGKSVFGKLSVKPNFAHGNTPGGLIDKRQQIDPASTTFGHPFDGGSFRSTSTGEQVPPKTTHNMTAVINPLKDPVPEVSPHERGTFFFRGKQVPIVKMQGGANQTGKPSNTAFHPQEGKFAPQPQARSAQATEKVQNKEKTPSFHSTGNLWGSGNHSFIKGRPNTISGTVGTGRWNIVKRGAA